jgi:hypothetical protein
MSPLIMPIPEFTVRDGTRAASDPVQARKDGSLWKASWRRRGRLLEEYIPEDEYCADTGQSRRKARGDRQVSRGPPFVIIARAPRASVLKWLKSLERHPARARKKAA